MKRGKYHFLSLQIQEDDNDFASNRMRVCAQGEIVLDVPHVEQGAVIFNRI